METCLDLIGLLNKIFMPCQEITVCVHGSGALGDHLKTGQR